MTSLKFNELQRWLNKNNPKINLNDSKYSEIQHYSGKSFVYDSKNNCLLEIYKNNNELKILKERAPYRILNSLKISEKSWNNKKKLFKESLNLNEDLENDTLNPALWKNNKLIPEVKDKILELIEEVKEYLSNVNLKILDVQIVGSNANYNYHDGSDIDLDIITRFEDYGKPEEMVSNLLWMSKNSFNNAYDINYKGYKVELYIQDVKAGVASNGVYSVIKDEWIKEPEKVDVPNVDLEPDLSEYKKEAEELLKSDDAEEISKFIDNLYVLRRNSLMVDGEFGKGNLIFKELRNDEILDKLKEKRLEIRSKELSLENINN